MDYKEIPIDDSEDELFDIDDDEIAEDDIEEIQRRSRIVTSEISMRLGIIVLILGAIALILIILTYFFNEGQPDKTLLLIEQIVGYVLVGIAFITGTSFLIYSRKLPSKTELILEPVTTNSVEDNNSNSQMKKDED